MVVLKIKLSGSVTTSFGYEIPVPTIPIERKVNTVAEALDILYEFNNCPTIRVDGAEITKE